MTTPRTKSGKALREQRLANSDDADDLGDAILAIEAEAIDQFLASPEAEKELAEAMPVFDIPTAHAILAAWRESRRSKK